MKNYSKFILGALLLVALLIACTKELSDDVIELFTIEASETTIDSFLNVQESVKITITGDTVFELGDYQLKYTVTDGAGMFSVGDSELIAENTFIELPDLENTIHYTGTSSGNNKVTVTIKDRNDREVDIILTYNVKNPGFNFDVIPTPVSGYIGGSITLDIDMDVSGDSDITYQTKYKILGATDITGSGVILIEGEALATDTYVDTPSDNFSWQFEGERLGVVKIEFTVKNSLDVELEKIFEIVVTEIPDFIFEATIVSDESIVIDNVLTIDFMLTETVGASSYIMNYTNSNTGSLEYNNVVYQPGDDITFLPGEGKGNYTGTEIGEHLLEFAVININTIPIQKNAMITVDYRDLDVTVPLIELNGDNEITIKTGTEFIDPGVTVSDNVDAVDDLILSVEGVVDTNTVGVYSIEYTVADTSKNKASVTRTVNVTKDDLPVITITGGDQVLNAVRGGVYADLGAIATDDIDGNITDDIVALNTVDITTPGIYKVTYTVRDSNDNTVSAERKVTINDTEAPVITLTGSTIEINQGTTYVETGGTVTDNVDDLSFSNVSISLGGLDIDTPGTYSIAYNIKDAAGNSAVEKTRTVTVIKDNPPVISITGGDRVLNAVRGGVYSDLGATATDDIDGNITVDIKVVSTVVLSTPGIYKVTYTVTDSNRNTVSKVRKVTINDTEKPVIKLTGGTVQIDQGDTYVEPGGTVTDNVNNLAFSSVTVSGTLNTSIPGSYTLSYNIKDAANNSAVTVSRIINVVDRIAPVIKLNGDSFITIQIGGSYTEMGATATDNYDPSVTVDIIGTVDTNIAGFYKVDYVAKDSSGNSSSDFRTVVVYNKPVARFSPRNVVGNAPLPVTFSAGGSESDGIILDVKWNFGDGSPEESHDVYDDVNHTFRTSGTYNVRIQIFDEFGGTDTASTTVTVN